jgi:hypothetical protein
VTANKKKKKKHHTTELHTRQDHQQPNKGVNNKQPVTKSKATGKLQPKRTTKTAAPTQQENNNNKKDNKS